MSVRETAAKFDVNPSTIQRIARLFDDAEHASVAAGRRHIGLWARQAGWARPRQTFCTASTSPI